MRLDSHPAAHELGWRQLQVRVPGWSGRYLPVVPTQPAWCPHRPPPPPLCLTVVAARLFDEPLTTAAAELFQEHADEMGAMRGH